MSVIFVNNFGLTTGNFSIIGTNNGVKMLEIFAGRVLNGFISLQEFASLFSDPTMDFNRLFLAIDVI